MNKKLLFILLIINCKLVINNCYAQWQQSGPYTGATYIKAQNGKLYSKLTDVSICKSTDNGNNWDFVWNAPTIAVYDVLDTAGVILLGTAEGVYKSTDNGASFQAANVGQSTLNGLLTPCNALFMASSNRILCATANLSYSDNLGQTWTTVYLANDTNSVSTYNFVKIGTTIFAIGSSRIVLKSVDNGTTWTKPTTAFTASTFPYGLVESNNILYMRAQVIDTVTFVSSYNFYKSTDMGVNWTIINTGFVAANDNDNYLIKANGKIFCNSTAGVYELNTATDTWALSSINPTAGIKLLGYHNGYYLALNKGTGLLSRSNNNGTTWTPVAKAMAFENSQRFSVSDKLYICGKNGVFAYDSLSNTWSRFTPYKYNFGGLVTSANYTNEVYDIKKGNNNTYYIAAEGGVYTSIDNGTTWVRHTTGLQISTYQRRKVNELYIHGDTLVAATAKGLYYSTNQANNFTLCTGSSNTAEYTDLLYHNGKLLASGPAIMQSVNGGISWALRNNGTIANSDYVAAGQDFALTTVNQAGRYYNQETDANWHQVVYSNGSSGSSNSFSIGYDSTFYMVAGGGVYSSKVTQLDTIKFLNFNLPKIIYYPLGVPFTSRAYLDNPFQNKSLAIYAGKLWLGSVSLSPFSIALNDPLIITGKLQRANVMINDVILYPNPTSDFLVLNIDILNARYIIINSLGVIMDNTILVSNQINVSNLTSGIYFITFISRDNRIIKTKFIKQ